MAGDYGVAKPGSMHRSDQCWAVVLQRSTGAMYRGIDNCSNKARPGCLTCARHSNREPEAQRRKAKLNL